MMHADLSNSAIRRLEHALRSGRLSPEMQTRGKRLLERLRSPVNVTVFGPCQAGSVGLVNVLAGRRLIPGHNRLTVAEVTWGPDDRVTLKRADGRSETRHGRLAPDAPLDGVTEIRVEAPLPLLERMRIRKIATNIADPAHDAVVCQAIAEANIALWSTAEFAGAERALWSHVPDRLKDHAFLVLAEAERLAADGILAERLRMLGETAGDEFYSIVPVATKRALNALMAGTARNEAEWTASGAAALEAFVQRDVEAGRQADLDSALLFLSRLGIDLPAEPETPAPRPDDAHSGAHASSPAEAEADTMRTKAPPPPDALRREALSLLTGETEALRDAIATGDSAAVLAACHGAAEMVAAELAGAPDGGPFAEIALDVADTLLLLQTESGVAAEDGLRALLQLRREIETAEVQ